jgi:putative hydrolase of the HAD superfamily
MIGPFPYSAVAMPTISTIFFDLDNTLVDYYSSDLTALTALKEQFFPDLSLNEFRSAWRTANIKNWGLYESGYLTIEGQRIKRVQETWEALGKKVDEAEAFAIFQLYLNVFKESFHVLPNAIEVLQALQQKSLPIGLITNGGAKEQRQKLAGMKLESFFQPELIFISEEVGCCKPEIEIFHKAQAAARVQPENILFVGDTFSHDIEPARKLNWNAWLIDHYNSEYDQTVDDHKITDLREVLKVVI